MVVGNKFYLDVIGFKLWIFSLKIGLNSSIHWSILEKKGSKESTTYQLQQDSSYDSFIKITKLLQRALANPIFVVLWSVITDFTFEIFTILIASV